MAHKKRKNKSSPSFPSCILIAAAAAAVIVLCLNPVMKLIYPLEYREYIEEAAQEYSLNPYLVMGVISAESRFDSDARSTKEAHGLMQIKDETALWCIENLALDIKADEIRTPQNNITIGCAYLNYLTKLYNGNEETAIAAYNAGLGNVNKWLSDKRYSDGGTDLRSIPFSETKDYVKKVANRKQIYEALYGKKTP